MHKTYGATAGARSVFLGGCTGVLLQTVICTPADGAFHTSDRRVPPFIGCGRSQV